MLNLGVCNGFVYAMTCVFVAKRCACDILSCEFSLLVLVLTFLYLIKIDA